MVLNTEKDKICLVTCQKNYDSLLESFLFDFNTRFLNKFFNGLNINEILKRDESLAEINVKNNPAGI